MLRTCPQLAPGSPVAQPCATVCDALYTREDDRMTASLALVSAAFWTACNGCAHGNHIMPGASHGSPNAQKLHVEPVSFAISDSCRALHPGGRPRGRRASVLERPIGECCESPCARAQPAIPVPAAALPPGRLARRRGVRARAARAAAGGAARACAPGGARRAPRAGRPRAAGSADSSRAFTRWSLLGCATRVPGCRQAGLRPGSCWTPDLRGWRAAHVGGACWTERLAGPRGWQSPAARRAPGADRLTHRCWRSWSCAWSRCCRARARA